MRNRMGHWVACLLLLSVIPLGLLFFAFGLPPQYGDTFLGALKGKCEALETVPGKRIVVIGGSGAAFGLRCDLMEDAIPGYSAVNFGMYAGLGTAVMLDLALPRLHTGDIVIFSPEQSEQTLSTYLGGVYFLQGAEEKPELLLDLRWEDFGSVLADLPEFAAQKVRFFRDGTPSGEGVYARSSFNRRGDIDYPDRTCNRMNGAWDRNMPITFDTQYPRNDLIERINEFTKKCEKRGIRVFYRFCPMNAAAVTNPEMGEVYQTWLAGELDCPVLGTAADSILDPEWFYDSNFHLNSAGAVANTACLTRQLQEALGICAGQIPVPEKPTLPLVQTAAGDSADADAFRYAQEEGGVMITAMTVQLQSVTVPTHWQGQPVLGFTAETFSGNTRIEQITLQENITQIPDGAFRGCTNLKRICMNSTVPSGCTVGRKLLEGTNAWVCVPREGLGAYLTNYFWSVHASRIRADGGEAAEEIPTDPVPTGGFIRYQGNGGLTRSAEAFVDRPADTAHLRVNTALATRYFTRPGYLPIGWNTQPDGSGTQIGFGSRTQRRDGMVLYAQWVPETPETAFGWEIREGGVWITGYCGTEAVCAVPETLEGLPVRGICTGAFADAVMQTLVLPPQMRTLEPGAFTGCTVETLYLFDSLVTVSDAAFAHCKNLQTIHINAATNPVYSVSYYAAFADKYDRLLSLAGQKKLVLFSGSSTRYGYDSPAIEAAYPQYQVANMGVFAYTNARPQLELLLAHMEAGDLLLHAPEFDTLENQFCTSSALDHHFWAMMEANYDAAAELDLRNYTGVFDSLGEFLRLRAGMPKRSYSDSPSGYDDDGNRYGFATYNAQGDLILPRPNAQRDEPLQKLQADYTAASFPPEVLEAMNSRYRAFQEKGVQVLFTYTPRNRSSLTARSTPQQRQTLDELLRSGLCVPVISDLEGSLYSGIYFYLIDSHLSTEGVQHFTQRIIENLKPWA